MGAHILPNGRHLILVGGLGVRLASLTTEGMGVSRPPLSEGADKLYFDIYAEGYSALSPLGHRRQWRLLHRPRSQRASARLRLL